MKKKNLRIGLFLLLILLLPLLHIGKEYIYPKFFLWALIFSIVILISDETPLPRKEYLFVLFIPLLITISTIFSSHPIWGLHISAIFWMATLFPLYFYNDLENIKSKNLILLTSFAISAIIVAIIGILQFYRYMPVPVDRYGKIDPSSTFGLSNFSAHYLVAVLPFLIYLSIASFSKKIYAAISATLVSIPLLYYLVIARNRAAMVALAALILLWLIMISRRYKIAVLSSVGAAIVLIFATGFWKYLDRILHSHFSLRDPSIGYRIHLWKASIVAYLKQPWGMGAGDFRFEIWKYIDRYLQGMVNRGDIIIQHAHNEYIEFSLESSILFLVILILLLYFFLKKNTRRPEIYPVTALFTIALFSFPFHLPGTLFLLSLFFFGSFTANRETKFYKSKIFKYVLGAIFLFYSFFLFRISIAEYHSRNGITEIIRRHWSAGEKEFTTAIENFSREPNYFYNRAVCRANLKMFKGAIRDLKKAISISPYEPQPYRMLGILYLKMGEKREGRKWLVKYLELIKTPVEFQPLHLVIATSLDTMDIPMAEKYLELAEKFYPQNIFTRLDKIAVFIAKREWIKAKNLSDKLRATSNSLPVEFYMMNLRIDEKLNLSPLQDLKMILAKRPDPSHLEKYIMAVWKEEGKKAAYAEMTKILKKYPSLLNYILGRENLRGLLENKGGKK